MNNIDSKIEAAMKVVKDEGGVLREDHSNKGIRNLLLYHNEGLRAAVDQHKLGYSQDSNGWFFSLPSTK